MGCCSSQPAPPSRRPRPRPIPCAAHPRQGVNHSRVSSTAKSKCDSPPPPRKVEFLNGGYWPSWKHYDGAAPSYVPFEHITHVHYAFAKIKDNGTIFLDDEYVHYNAEVDGAKGCLQAWTQRKKYNPDLKITLAIGGGGSDSAKQFASVASNSIKRFFFVRSVKQLIDKFELDGVDIDWEYPTGPEEPKAYLQLLSDLREVVGWHRWVSVALPASSWVLDKLDLPEISKAVDFINLMAYDFVDPTFANVTKTGHHARLHQDAASDEDAERICGASAVQYLLDHGVPSRQIVLGVPTYGRCFKGAGGPNQAFQQPEDGAEVTYEVRDLPRPGMIEKTDRTAVAAFASGNGNFITYDNRDTVRKKAEYAKKKNLRGLFYWHLAGDRPGVDSLVGAGYHALVSKPQALCKHI